MKTRPWLLASLLVAGLMAVLGREALRRLPAGAVLPTHFDAAGDPNGWTDAASAVWIMPALVVVIALVLSAIPRIEPRQDRLEASAPVLRTAWAAVVAVLALCHLRIVEPAFGWHLPGGLPLIGVGLLLIATGNVLPKSRPGYFVGIRTPWALSDDDNWIATHRLGGRLFMVAGALVVVAGLAPLGAGVRTGMVLGSVLIAAAVPYAASWWWWSRGKDVPPAG